MSVKYVFFEKIVKYKKRKQLLLKLLIMDVFFLFWKNVV